MRYDNVYDLVTMNELSQFNLINALLDYNLYFIVEEIFLYLDCQSLTNCEIAFKKWRWLIERR